MSSSVADDVRGVGGKEAAGATPSQATGGDFDLDADAAAFGSGLDTGCVATGTWAAGVSTPGTGCSGG